jgi:hypothetical protein
VSGTDLEEVKSLSERITTYADELRKVSQVFNGYELGGVKFTGTKLAYEEAVDDEVDAQAQKYEDEGKRSPAKEILYIRARKIVKREKPDLYDDYFIQKATKERIERWLGDAKSALYGHQSVLKTEREMTGYYGRQSQAGVGQ